MLKKIIMLFKSCPLTTQYMLPITGDNLGTQINKLSPITSYLTRYTKKTSLLYQHFQT